MDNGSMFISVVMLCTKKKIWTNIDVAGIDEIPLCFLLIGSSMYNDPVEIIWNEKDNTLVLVTDLNKYKISQNTSKFILVLQVLIYLVSSRVFLRKISYMDIYSCIDYASCYQVVLLENSALSVLLANSVMYNKETPNIFIFIISTYNAKNWTFKNRSNEIKSRTIR